MSNNCFDNWNVPDYSELNETINQINEMTLPILELVQEFQEIMSPIFESVKQCFDEVTAIGINRGITESLRPIFAIGKLGEAQFVYWNYMTSEFIDNIMDSDNINKTLSEYIARDEFKAINDTIAKCNSNPIMKKHLRLYNQSVEAFRNENNDLAVTGFTSVFDGLLSDVSKDHTHKLRQRINVINEKFENGEMLDQDEYSTFILSFTFEEMLDSFSKTVPFDQKEPEDLNRHWIAHGRSHRKKTKLDCVKMINFIYGLLLVAELYDDSTQEHDKME